MKGATTDLPQRDSALFQKVDIVVTPACSFVCVIADHNEFKLPEYEIMDHEID
jgi:hypothetical protein